MNLLRQRHLNPEGCPSRRCILREAAHYQSLSPGPGRGEGTAARRRESGSFWRRYGWLRKGCCAETWSGWCEGRVKVARSTRSRRDTTQQHQAGGPSLYSRPRWQRLFPGQYPAGSALPAPNMVRFSKVPKSWLVIFSCYVLIIEASASKCHVLEECAMRIGEGVVHVGAYGVDGRSPCRGIGTL